MNMRSHLDTPSELRTRLVLRRSGVAWCFSLLATLLLLVASNNTLLAQEHQVDFNAEVRPILSNTCFHCHGPDENTRKADLRLDQKQGLFEDRGGYAAVKPGNVTLSELIRRIRSTDPDEMMPPPDSNKSITAAQQDTLIRWVKQGATWKQHWAFVAPERSEAPQTADSKWCRNEIDRFVLQKIEAAGLTVSKPAEPHILLRRLYLDLIGLPPTPAETDHWLSKICGPQASAIDASESSSSSAGITITGELNEAAWQELIGHLLASQHYGERWARRWLDLARYADTNGYEKDRDRSIWPYRDWVINAINNDMPFDKFTIEQLAGDMLPNATVSQRIATGFHRNTMLNEEGGIDPMEFRYHAMTDRVATTGTTWLGLTLGCCQCHTHKYDPVSHTEYYQIFAYLNNADEPLLDLPDAKLNEAWQKNIAKADELLTALPNMWPVDELDHVASKITRAEADGQQTVKVIGESSIAVSDANPDASTYVVDLQASNCVFDSIRLDTKATGRSRGPGRTPHGNFVLSEIVFEVIENGGVAIRLPVTSATASVEQSSYEIGKAFDANEDTGWAIHGAGGVPKSAVATFDLDFSGVTLPLPDNAILRVTLQQLSGGKHTIGNFGLSLLRQRTPEQVEEQKHQQLAAAFAEWRRIEVPHAVDWRILIPTAATSNLPILTIQDDHSIFASGDTAKRDDYMITLAASDRPITSLRLEALPDLRLPAGGPGSTYYEGTLGDFYLTEMSAKSGSKEFPFSAATQTYSKNRFGSNPATAALAIDNDIQTGWSVHDRQGAAHVAVFVFAKPVPANTPVTIHMSFGRHFASSLGRFRFSATDAAKAPEARMYSPEVASLLLQPEHLLTQREEQLLQNAFLTSTPELSQQSETIRKLRMRPAATSSLVLQSRPPEHTRPTFRHHRGEYLQPKEPVTVGLPSVLIPSGQDAPKNRLEFAKWLVSTQNPLTARVVINRHWAAFFGTGIVKTLDDFGLQGESPSHPELLDWLAVSFATDDNWSLRKLHRRIVSSATYRQASKATADAVHMDPDNRLLTHANRIRLDAEIIRDQLLLAAGVLSPEVGGPPVRPPQPQGVTESAYGSPSWTASKGTDRYRRSLYTFIKRTAPFAMFSTFDAPSGEACIADRDRSNSPLQALTLLNDVMLMDLAQQAGRHLMERRETDSTTQLLTALFRRTLVRLPTTDELQLLEQFYEEQRTAFATDFIRAAAFVGLESAENTDSQQLAEQAAWTATARAVFGLDETLSRE